MAVVRHFALNLVRQAKDKRAIKRRRKMASWDPTYLADILGGTHQLSWTSCGCRPCTDRRRVIKCFREEACSGITLEPIRHVAVSGPQSCCRPTQ
jgi:hypothetical protein